MNRDMVFISHANPEDNDFSRWLALQLAKDGYGVWCDLTKLLGGENFWKDAEEAIRSRTIKFLYVLSRTSNTKDGPRNELQIAKNIARADQSLHDFVIPLHVDALPHGEINVLLTSLNAISFERSWAKGYSQLVEVLERETVPKNANFGPASVSTWWRGQFSANRGVSQKPETYLSNLLPVLSMPESIWLHTLEPTRTGPVEPEHRLGFAGFMDGIDIVTFASADDVRPALGSSARLWDSNALSVSDLLQGKSRLEAKKGRYFLSRLMRECWEQWIGTTGLRSYALSNKSQCHFFPKRDQPRLNIQFKTPEGHQAWRGVVGYATQADGTLRYWHYGVQSRPMFAPRLSYMLSAHVIFTSDGATPWTSHRRMHSARRRQCKNWFNPHWRDRLLATLHWLSQGNSSLRIPCGKLAFIEVSSLPQAFESDVSYADPPTRKERLLVGDHDQSDSVLVEEEEEIESVDDDEDSEDIDEEEET
jgi:hypothetical protein